MHRGDKVLKASLQPQSAHLALACMLMSIVRPAPVTIVMLSRLRIALPWLAPSNQALIDYDSMSLLHLSQMKGRLFKGTPSVEGGAGGQNVWLGAESWPAKSEILKKIFKSWSKNSVVPNFWPKACVMSVSLAVSASTRVMLGKTYTIATIQPILTSKNGDFILT